MGTFKRIGSPKRMVKAASGKPEAGGLMATSTVASPADLDRKLRARKDSIMWILVASCAELRIALIVITSRAQTTGFALAVANQAIRLRVRSIEGELGPESMVKP